jgi:hypothetical protein
MRLSLLKAAHVDVGESTVAGNPGRPSFSAHVRWGERGAPVQFLLGSARAQTPPGGSSEFSMLGGRYFQQFARSLFSPDLPPTIPQKSPNAADEPEDSVALAAGSGK